MTRLGKLLERERQGRSLSFDEFCRLMEAFGYVHTRTTGSHRMYRHPRIGDLRTVQPRGKEAKLYQVDQFFDMVSMHGLTLDD